MTFASFVAGGKKPQRVIARETLKAAYDAAQVVRGSNPQELAGAA